MSATQLFLYDDARAGRWLPFTATRPAGELMLGAFTMRARAERILRTTCTAQVAGAHLLGFDEPGAAPVIDYAAVPNSVGQLFLSARAVLDWSAAFSAPARPATLVIGGEIAGFWVPPDAAAPSREDLLGESNPAGSETVELPGRMLRNVWQLITENGAQLEHDVMAAAPPPRPLPGHAAVLGDLRDVRLGRDVAIEPAVVLDVRDGPIWLDDDVTVRAFTRLAGPAYVGTGSTLLGGPYSGISIGPVCKVHGEMEETVVLGFANKAHDGFLGHAYVGRWANLGALTTNSDLKNNYGTIRLWTPDGEVDTGEIKIGCLLGDHVKTGIGVMLNTGTVVGPGSNVFGAVQPPKYVPPFSWGAGDALRTYQLDRFMTTAETVMGRRGVELTPGVRAVLRAAWHATHGTEVS